MQILHVCCMVEHLILICHSVGRFLHRTDQTATSILFPFLPLFLFVSLFHFFFFFSFATWLSFRFQTHLVYASVLLKRYLADLAGAESAILRGIPLKLGGGVLIFFFFVRLFLSPTYVEVFVLFFLKNQKQKAETKLFI